MNQIINATLCYLIQDGQVLMLHRTKKQNDLFRNFWNGIGGKLEINESPEKCVKREVLEETGLRVDHVQLRGINTYPNNRGTGDTWIVYVYEANKYSGNLKDCPEGQLQWIPVSELFKLNLQQADHHFLKWLIEKIFYSATFLYERDELVDLDVCYY